MGNKPSKRSIQPFLLKYVSEFSYESTLNKNYIYNSVLADIEEEGPIICKMYFDTSRINIARFYEDILMEFQKMQDIFNVHSSPNILPYHSWVIRNNNCLLIMRQYMYQSLKTKINQKWEIIEKKWLTFQLLNAVSQLHSKAITHGDIKPENILLTSYDWLFLTDFLTIHDVYDVSLRDEKEKRLINYKPTYVEEDVWKIYNMFFGDLDNNKRCYIAPERWLNNIEYYQKTSGNYLVQPSMDVFSVGWVIAEIFLDGKPLFDLARHQLYRKGEFNPKDLLCIIDDEEVEALIMDMISLDPQNRKSIDAYRQEWISKIFPVSFTSILFQIGSSMLRENIIISDERISMIRKYFDAAWISCFGEEIGPQELLVPTNPKLFEFLRFENFPNIITDLYPDYDCIISHKNNGERNIGKIEFKSEKEKIAANDSTLVLITFIGTFLATARYPDSKVMALEMLKCLGTQIREEFRLQYVVPYCISCFYDRVSKVRITAIDSLIEVLKDWESIEIGHTDYYVFDTYLFPSFLKLLDDEDKLVQLKFIEKLPYLVNIGKMLIASVNLHKQKITMIAKEDQTPHDQDQEERENLLFECLDYEVPLELYNIRKKTEYEDDKFDPSEPTEAAESSKDIDNEHTEEEIKAIADEDKKNKEEFAQSLLNDNNLVSWSRKRFVTDEQKIRSVLGIGYNMSLNDNDSDISDDPEQENEVEKEIDGLREKIFEVVDKIISEQDILK